MRVTSCTERVCHCTLLNTCSFESEFLNHFILTSEAFTLQEFPKQNIKHGNGISFWQRVTLRGLTSSLCTSVSVGCGSRRLKSVWCFFLSLSLSPSTETSWTSLKQCNASPPFNVLQRNWWDFSRSAKLEWQNKTLKIREKKRKSCLNPCVTTSSKTPFHNFSTGLYSFLLLVSKGDAKQTWSLVP